MCDLGVDVRADTAHAPLDESRSDTELAGAVDGGEE